MVRKTKPPQKKSTNLWDLLIRITDLTYSLVNSGNIIGAIILCFILWVLMITARTPPNELAPLVRLSVDILSNAKAGYAFLGIALFISLFANVTMYRTYKAEIKRLTDQRKELMHGLKTGTLSAIKAHVSCNTDI